MTSGAVGEHIWDYIAKQCRSRRAAALPRFLLQCRSAQCSAFRASVVSVPVLPFLRRHCFKHIRALAGWGKEHNCYAPPDLDSCAHRRLTELHPSANAILRASRVQFGMAKRMSNVLYVAVIAEISVLSCKQGLR
jgi:hypothetical protein